MRTLPVSTRTCAIALIAAAAIALTACGGGGLSSDDEASLQDDLKAAEAAAEAALAQAAADAAARAAAEAAQAAAEAAQTAAEAAQAEAEAAQAAAETQAAADRAARETAEAQAEADRLARVAAEAQAESALTAQRTAEAEADAARTAQRTAEAEAEAARTAQAAAEAAQAAAEAARAAAETNTAEAIRLAEQARMDREAANRAAMEAEAARVAALVEQTRAEAERDAAESAQREAETAQREAETAQREAETAQREAETAQREAEAERDEAERLLRLAQQEALTAEQQRQAAETEQERLRLEAERQREQLEREVTEAEQAALNARASEYIAAINDGGTDRTSVSVTYMRGDTLRINPGGNFETGSGAPAISGFTPRTYTREVGVIGEQTLYHYTNIQAPGTRAFWKIHGLEVAAAGATALNGNTANNPTPTGTPRVVKAGDDDLAYETPATYNIVVSGTYDGVSGTYTCAGADCTIEDTDGVTGITRADFSPSAFATLTGEREFVIGSWSFKPGSITSGVRQAQDTEYLYFGIWVNEPHVASATHSYQYFGDGSGSLTPTEFGLLTGTAKFRGGAVGKYVTRNQVGENAKIGTFTAAANFTATFGTSPTLEGRLTDFRDSSQALTGWNVYLGGANNQPAAFAGGALTDQPASATIGGVNATGTWNATLHGTDNPGRAQLAADPDHATKYPIARFPQADLAGLVGNFHATNDIDRTLDNAADATAAIAGAFAATPQ